MPDVAALLFAPLSGVPDCSRMRRTPIRPVDPYVTVPVPAVISRHPYESLARGGYDFHRTRRRRPYADDDLCVGSAHCKKESAGCDEKLFLHLVDLLILLVNLDADSARRVVARETIQAGWVTASRCAEE
jgi:hypothetical protein